MLSALLLGVLYCLIPLIVVGCFVEFPPIKKWFPLFATLVIACFGGLAYVSFPYPGSDLSRYFVELGLMRLYDWSYLPNALYASTPLTNIFLYIVSLTGDFHLFPCLSAGTATALLLFVWSREVDADHRSARSLFLTLAASLSINGLLSILIGGRQHLALAFMLFAVWYDLENKNKRSWIALILYLIPLLIHLGVSPIFLARGLVGLTKRKDIRFAIMFTILFGVVTGPLLEFAGARGIGGTLVQEIAGKFIEYQSIKIADWRIHALNFGFCLLMFVSTIRLLNNNADTSRNRIVLYSLVLALCNSMNYHLMSRILAFAIYAALPIVDLQLKRIHESKIDWICFSLLVLSGLLGIAYQYISIINQWELTWI